MSSGGGSALPAIRLHTAVHRLRAAVPPDVGVHHETRRKAARAAFPRAEREWWLAVGATPYTDRWLVWNLVAGDAREVLGLL